MNVRDAIIEEYITHLSLSEPSKLPERLRFSCWMYKYHPDRVTEIAAIWKVMKAK